MNPFHPPVIAALDDRDVARLLERSVTRRLQRHERLFLTGDPARRVHLVTSGVLKLTASDGDGNETVLALALRGDFVGDIAALDGLPQPLDAVAAGPTSVVSFETRRFLEVLGRNPDAALQLALSLATKLRWMTDTAFERTSSSVGARLAGRLLNLATSLGCENPHGGVDIDLPIGQADLGSLAGMCRESACKTLRRLKRAGVVDYRGRKLRILRPEVLERIRCGALAAAPSRSARAGAPELSRRGREA